MSEAIIICLIQHFEADFLRKVSLKNAELGKMLNSGKILKTFTHAYPNSVQPAAFDLCFFAIYT